MTAPAATMPAMTEADVLRLLERHYARPGNGGSGEYAFLRHVRNDSGFKATRTFDAVLVGLWPSRGHDVHVFEVKVARSDWRRELSKPDKAEDAAKVADRFSVVAPRGVVDLAEVPATWGYIEITGSGDSQRARVVRAAPLLRPADECRGPIPRGLLVAMLRAAGAVPDPVPPEQHVIDAAVREAVTRERDRHRQELDDARQSARDAARGLHEFRSLAGIHWHGDEQMRARAAEVKTALAGTQSPRHAAAVIEEAGRDLARTVERLARVATELRAGDPS